jgi:hypothetical protein
MQISLVQLHVAKDALLSTNFQRLAELIGGIAAEKKQRGKHCESFTYQMQLYSLRLFQKLAHRPCARRSRSQGLVKGRQSAYGPATRAKSGRLVQQSQTPGS